MKGDRTLVSLFQQGDERAFEALFHRHKGMVYSFFYHLTFRRLQSEELLQETFVKLWGGLQRFHPRSSLKNYIYRIARNTWIDHLRRKKPREISFHASPEGRSDSEPLARRGNPEATAMAKELRRAVLAALDKLPPEMREILVLSKYQGLKNREIAHILDIPVGTVESRLSRSYRRLRRLLSRWQQPSRNLE